MGTSIRKTLPLVLFLGLLVGCETPHATLDLISVARKGMATTRQSQSALHQEIITHLETRKKSLDHAFDTDVVLVASGKLQNSDGEEITLSPEWVISARKGYAAARDIIDSEIQSAQRTHSTQMDNIVAADEALDMASQLIVQQWDVSEKIKQQLLNIQRRFSDGR